MLLNSRCLPSLSWVKMIQWIFFVKKGWIQHSRILDGCHHQVESEWMSEVFCTKWLNPRWSNSRWQNLRWLPSSSLFRMNEWSFLWKWWKPIMASVSKFERKYYEGWIQDGQIQDGRIQDGCHHEVRWEWMSLSQIELVWVSIRVEWEYIVSKSERR